jgi:hypothetical protein
VVRLQAGDLHGSDRIVTPDKVKFAAQLDLMLNLRSADKFQIAKTRPSDIKWLHGVVGYHMCLTHTRSPDRAWVKSSK